MALAHAIMTALIDDEMSGYELARSFDNSLGFFWQASHQQIYQELRKLAERKWLKRREVRQSGKPDKISYRLTRRGRRALASAPDVLGAVPDERRNGRQSAARATAVRRFERGVALGGLDRGGSAVRGVSFARRQPRLYGS